jgi:hypothetical protein
MGSDGRAEEEWFVQSLWRPAGLPRADAAAHHRRGHGMVALFISQQAIAADLRS